MHILLITHYYEPDAGVAAIRLSRLAKRLVKRGHRVTVLAPMPHYQKGRIDPPYRGHFSFREDREGVETLRVWLWTHPSPSIKYRLLSQLSFMILGFIRGLFLPRPDVILVENQPVFTGFMAWGLAKFKRRPYLLNVSDFWPEYLIVSGVTQEDSLIYRLFKAIVNRTQKSAAGIVVLYPSLLEKIEARIGKVERSAVIYSAVELDRIHPEIDASAFRAAQKISRRWIVNFVGILGYHIDLETMIKAMQALQHRADIGFIFVGAGTQLPLLEKVIAAGELNNCQLLGWLAFDQIPQVWAASDLCFWAVKDNELDRLRYQAKLYEALASGTPPVIALEGMMSDIIGAEQIGKTVAFGDSEALAGAILAYIDDPQSLQDSAQKARAYAEAHYDPEKVMEAYEQMLMAIR
ncbi:glycosyltransferase family 4 protein [Anaerolineales bacterium]